MKKVINIKEGNMERVFSIIFFVTGTVFLVMALVCGWRYFFTMVVCYAAGLLVKEVADEE